MQKWVIILLIALGCYLVFDQVTSFVGKVNTTVGKANNSMEREATSVNQASDYNYR